MKYQLKDRELHAKIEAIYPYFGVLLSRSVRNGDTTTSMIILPNQGIEITLKISNSAIEKVPEKWTKWPYENPTVDGYYQVEYKHNLQAVKDVWVWLDGSWVRDCSNFPSAWKPDFQDVRFKPWDDPDSDEDGAQ